MAFRSRLKEFRRLCTVYSGHFEVNQPLYCRNLVPVSNRVSFNAHSNRFEASHIVRFYAAPYEGNQKKEEKDSREPKLNEQITVPSVRLVTEEGHFVVSRYEALSRARNLKLDLVLVDGQETPPVCKIFDYKKEKYVQQMKEKERAKKKMAATLKKGSPKEIRFSGKITQNDLKVKADMVKRLMESGHRVKCTAIEPTDSMDMKTLLSRFSALIEDVAVVESGPRVEKKQAFVVVRHVKFGPLKKGSSKKASNATTQHKDSDELTDEDAQANESGSNEDVHAVFNKPADSPAIANRYATPKTEPEKRYAKVPPRPDMENRYSKAPPRPETENRYANVTQNPGIENRYGKVPPNPETENRYSKVPLRPGIENGYANVPPSQSNQYARVPRSPRTMANDAADGHNHRHQADVSIHEENQARGGFSSFPIKSYGPFRTQPDPGISSMEVTNRYKKNLPPDFPRDSGFGGVPQSGNFLTETKWR